MRFQRGLLTLCSKTSVTGFRFQEDTKTWNPKFVINGGDTILDSLLVHETKLLVLSIKERVLEWQIHDYKELTTTYLITKNAVKFHPGYHWSAAKYELPFADVLDTSSEGLCLISSDESDVWVIDLMKEGDNPASGWAGNGGENNSGGYGCFLRSCGIDGHQAPFIFCGRKYLEWAVCQKHKSQTINIAMEERIKELESNKAIDWEVSLAAAKRPAPDDRLMEKYENISGWQSNEIDCNDEYTVFPFCYHYSSGVAFVWNNERATVSAVLLLEYTEQKGNCRLYEGSGYIDGYYPAN